MTHTIGIYKHGKTINVDDLPEGFTEIMAEEDAYASYEDMLNDSHDIITIGYIELYPADVLRECDPIAYRTGFADYIDMLAEDGIAVEGWI